MWHIPMWYIPIWHIPMHIGAHRAHRDTSGHIGVHRDRSRLSESIIPPRNAGGNARARISNLSPDFPHRTFWLDTNH